MIILLLRTILVCVFAWILWQNVLRPFVVKSPLDNIPGPPATSFLTGDLSTFVDRKGWDFHLRLVREYAPVVKFKGILGAPILYVYDPKALQSVVLKDQNVYEESPMFIKLNHLMFGSSLLATLGEVHRRQRKMLIPAFSVAHLRDLLPIFYRVADRVRIAIDSRVADGPKELDMLGWMGRTSLELIGQAGLGYSFDPLTKDASDEYGSAIKALFPQVFSLGVIRYLLPLLMEIGSPSFRRRVVELIPSRRVQRLKDTIDTLSRRSKEIADAKRDALLKGDEALKQQVGEGKDIISILMRASMDAKSEEDKMSDEELLAHMSTITFAATDTTSSTLSQILELLAKHPDAQEKLREELLEARHDDEKLSYDELMRLPYLDAVCRETLRMHPPLAILDREAERDIIMPLSQPIQGVDGRMISEIPVPKGTRIFVGTAGAHMSKALWGEDALEWKPERWLSPLPSTIAEARMPGVYANLMSFMGGSRACIGFKFSELEMKVVLSTLVPTFTFERTDKPIVWNVAGVRYPSVGWEGTGPEMPLKVGLLKQCRA